jgi:hypothetical protein
MTESLLLDENANRFDLAANALIAAGDDRALLDLAASLPGLVDGMRAAGESADVGIPVTNASALAAVCLRRGKPGVVDPVIEAMFETYKLGDLDAISADDADHQLWQATAASLWALGATAAHESAWATIRSIVARTAHPGDAHYQSWLRHGQVMSARGDFDPKDDNLLPLAEQRLRRSPSYGLDAGSDEDRRRWVCVFDQLALLVTRTLDGAVWNSYYPSYAKYPVAYVEPSIIDLRDLGAMRTAIFPGTDQDLRELLRDANDRAMVQASQYRAAGRGWEYEGFQDARTIVFITAGQRFEDWGSLPGVAPKPTSG